MVAQILNFNKWYSKLSAVSRSPRIFLEIRNGNPCFFFIYRRFIFFPQLLRILFFSLSLFCHFFVGIGIEWLIFLQLWNWWIDWEWANWLEIARKIEKARRLEVAMHRRLSLIWIMPTEKRKNSAKFVAFVFLFSTKYALMSWLFTVHCSLRSFSSLFIYYFVFSSSFSLPFPPFSTSFSYLYISKHKIARIFFFSHLILIVLFYIVFLCLNIFSCLVKI